MLKTKVKVSAIENLSDARYCAGMGVEWLGFSMTDVPLDKFNEIRNWLSGVQIVGEAFNCSEDQIITLCESYQPDVLEISSSTHLEKIKHLTFGIHLITLEVSKNLDLVCVHLQVDIGKEQ